MGNRVKQNFCLVICGRILKEKEFIICGFLSSKATAEANNLAAAASAKDVYYNNMEEVCWT